MTRAEATTNGSLRPTVTAQLNRGLMAVPCRDNRKLMAMAYEEWEKRNPNALNVTLMNSLARRLVSTRDTHHIIVRGDNQETCSCRVG